jgi:hypothetical protein
VGAGSGEKCGRSHDGRSDRHGVGGNDDIVQRQEIEVKDCVENVSDLDQLVFKESCNAKNVEAAERACVVMKTCRTGWLWSFIQTSPRIGCGCYSHCLPPLQPPQTHLPGRSLIKQSLWMPTV